MQERERERERERLGREKQKSKRLTKWKKGPLQKWYIPKKQDACALNKMQDLKNLPPCYDPIIQKIMKQHKSV